MVRLRIKLIKCCWRLSVSNVRKIACPTPSHKRPTYWRKVALFDQSVACHLDISGSKKVVVNVGSAAK